MALAQSSGTGGGAESLRTVNAAASNVAPAWVFPLYLAGLVLIYLGERVLSGLERGSGVVTALGVLVVLAATAARFSPRFRVGGERKSIETLLAVLSLIGVVALLIYFSTKGILAERLGIPELPSETRQKVEGISSVIWAALIAVSVIPMLFAETALHSMRRAERPESRRIRAAAAAGLTLVLAAVYGALFVYTADSLYLKVDYSYFKTARPSDSTRKITQSLPEPIQVVAFFPEVNEVRREVQGYLRELSQSSPKLRVEMHDRLLSPKLARDLKAGQDGMIVLARGSATHNLYIGEEMNAARSKLKTLDRDFQEQLLKLARADRSAYFTVGHGEIVEPFRPGAEAQGRTGRIVKTLLEKQNFKVKDLGVAQGLGTEVPDDADVVLILGPTDSFLKEELAALRRYTARGGHLLAALDPDVNSLQNVLAGAEAQAPALDPKKTGTPANLEPKKPDKVAQAGQPGESKPEPSPAPPHLAALAGLLEIRFLPDVLAHDKQHVRLSFNDSDKTRLILDKFSSHASVSTLSRNSPRAAVVMFGAGSLDLAENSKNRVDFTVRTSNEAYADSNRNYQFDTGTEKRGSFSLAAAITRQLGATPAPDGAKDKDKKESKPEPKETRLFVTADSDVFTDIALSNVVANQVFLLDAVRWLVGEESFSGSVNNEEDIKIEHTKQQDLAWFYATIFGGPLVVLGLGVFASRQSRKNRGAKA